MLEVCPSIALGQPTCEIHPLTIGDRGDPVRLAFDAKPGPALVVGLVDLGNRLRLVANQVNIVAPNEPLKRLPSARAVWAPEPSLAISAECWLLAGGPHHTVLTTAVEADCLAEFAEINQIELVMIDSDTSPRRFRDEERWNRAYWRLATPI